MSNRTPIIDLSMIDYKNVELLNEYTSRYGSIVARQYTGVSVKAQKKLAQAVKRARFMGLMPFVN